MDRVLLKPKITVREATKDDESVILDMLRAMGHEMAICEVDDDLVHERVGLVLGKGICFIAEVDGRPAGTIGLLGERVSWFTRERAIRDTWCFVAQQYRPLRVFAEMMSMCRKYADQVGAPLYFNLFTVIGTSRKHRLFMRHAQACLVKFYRYQPIGADYRIKEERDVRWPR